MAKVIIEESDMCFGEYDSSNVFQIEKCSQYTSKLRDSGIKITEFILLKDKKLLMIEAKKSCPNSETYMSSKEKQLKYDEYISSITSKFKNTLNLYISIILKRYSQDKLPTKFTMLEHSTLDLVFILVVKNAESHWLSHYQEVLQKNLSEEIKVWKIRGLLVINEDTARAKKLIK